MPTFRKLLKKHIPGAILRVLRKVLGRPEWELREEYGWSGDYADWGSAVRETSGYDADVIINKTLLAARQVRDGKAAFERDAFLFDEPDYNWPLIASLMHVAAVEQGRLRVVDFGGALGSTYFQNRRFLEPLAEISWCVVEQSAYCTIGQREFTTEKLQFLATIQKAVRSGPNVMLCSSVLQYLERPYEFLREVVRSEVPYLLFDRTSFTMNDNDRLTIQRVPPWIYPASYPCWFFGRSKFLDILDSHYEKVIEFRALDQANIPSDFRGFLFKRKEKVES